MKEWSYVKGCENVTLAYIYNQLNTEVFPDGPLKGFS